MSKTTDRTCIHFDGSDDYLIADLPKTIEMESYT